MSTTNYEGHYVPSFLHRFRLQRGLAFGVIIITALLAFELFNYSTTDFALSDLLGDLKFLGIRWATILSIAFCGIDFAGIARLFTPEEGSNEPNEVWYLFGAWLLAATMNAMLTWWGVSLAVLGHQTLGNAVVNRETLLRIVPIFVAVLVWLIRVLIIGTFSVAGERLFSQSEQPHSKPRSYPRVSTASAPVRSLSSRAQSSRGNANSASLARSIAKSASQSDSGYNRPEPTYHPVSMNASQNSSGANSHTARPPINRPGASPRR
ncbi:MAG: hypothetical protein AB1894_25795 [Chloroflexota bacterium]